MNLARFSLHGLLVASLVVAGCGMLKPKPKKPFGEPCTNALDCESMKCNIERGGMCTKDCHADSECGGDLVCAGDPTGTSGSCAKKSGTPTGGACHDRPECDHGACLHKGEDENGFCSQRCLTTADCPAGYKVCAAISDMGAQKLCLPGESGTSTPPKIIQKKGGAAPPPGKPVAPPAAPPTKK